MHSEPHGCQYSVDNQKMRLKRHFWRIGTHFRRSAPENHLSKIKEKMPPRKVKRQKGPKVLTYESAGYSGYIRAF